MAVAGFVLQGSVAKSPLSGGWIMMPHARSVQPGADKITPARQLSHIHDGGCLWLCGLSLTLNFRLGGNYVSKAGLRLTPILLAQLPKCMEYTSEPRNDLRRPTEIVPTLLNALYAHWKSPSACTQDFRHKDFLGLHLYSILTFFKLPIHVI